MALPAGRYGVTKNQLLKIKKLPMNTMGMITETKEGIAIIEDGAKASQLITAGRQFWHNGKLYSADENIAKDADIITSGEGKNATEMPNITDQLPGTDAEKANEITIARVENGTNPTATINAGEQFYHSGVLYTATIDITTTDIITPNTNCSVSDSVTGQIKAVKDSQTQLLKDTVGWTGKNQLDITEPISSPQHTVTIAVNSNKSISFNNTADAQFYFYINRNVLLDENEKYILTGVSPNQYGCKLQIYDNTHSAWVDGGDTGSGFTITGYSNIRVAVVIPKNAVMDSVTWYPMIRKANIIDPIYEPYHASVEDSLEQKCDNSVIGTVEGANASKAWSVGEHFINGGQFKEVTQAIASGGAINDSNTVNKPIADFLKTVSSDITSDRTYITVDSARKVAYKRNNVVSFRVRFTLSQDISSLTSILIMPFGLPISLMYFPIIKSDTEIKGIAFCNTTTNGMFINVLEAGTYDISGTYICQ